MVTIERCLSHVNRGLNNEYNENVTISGVCVGLRPKESKPKSHLLVLGFQTIFHL
jgi:hypothetical protein